MSTLASVSAPVEPVLASSQPSEGALSSKQSLQAALPSQRPPETAWIDRLPSGVALSARSRLALDQVSLDRYPSRAASLEPLRGNAPARAKISYPVQEEPVERLPSARSMVRSSSLVRLPSQIVLPMAASMPDSASDDSSITSMQQLSQHSAQTLQHLRQRLFQVSANLIHPFHGPIQKSHPLLLHSASGGPLRGLTFTPGGGRYRMDPREAFTAMSEGLVQCAVTGDAFEYLLQLQDASLLEAVMRNAVIFSRMKVSRQAAWFLVDFSIHLCTASIVPLCSPIRHAL